MRMLKRCPAIFAAVALTALAASASAAPILTGTATVAFSGDFGNGPGSEAASDVVSIGVGPEIQVGDGTDIGTNVLLDFEYLDLEGLTITYRILGGANVDAVQAGYGNNGMVSGAFTFSGLTFAPGASIVGFELSLTDVLGSSSDVSFTANSLTIGNLQNFLIRESGENTGLITVRLITREDQPPPPAPEPGLLALIGVGVLAGGRRAVRKR